MAAKSKSKPVQTQKANSKEKAAAAPLTETFRPGFWSRHWMPSLILLGMAFALYYIGLKYGFVLNNEMTYWKNEYVLKGLDGLKQIQHRQLHGFL